MSSIRFIHTLVLLAAFFSAFSLSVHAAWYQASASSKVINGQIDAARQNAIEEAVKQALLFSGASITSSQQVTNGLLTQDLFMVRASGVVNEIELVEEKIHRGQLSVTIRADIFADNRQCFTADYKKSAILLPLQIRNQNQAQIGGLYELGLTLGERIYKTMSQTATHLNLRDYYTNSILYASRGDKNQKSQIADANILSILAEKSDVQLIITGEITDLSMGQPNNKVAQWFTGEHAERYFEMQISIFDAFSGEKIRTFEYQSEAMWEFDVRRPVDIRSRKFWQSAYGSTITQNIAKATNEIDNALACTSAQGRIVDTKDLQLRFNLGRANNVHVGDRFKILHKASFTDKAGHSRPHFIVSRHEVEVTQVYGSSSVARSVNNQLLGNIQPGDIVRPSGNFDLNGKPY
ncbi:flagella assembly protein FlgT [Catenovulum sediminis]|uniref:Flagellar assembly protein T N-terminal domain-containing protein n=1 Tax=Catenovulum sediminis TaxID=1740262 RepID=A0ABV1RH39_9ALTE|nr:flagella assembly protein FlgT [Catenovulum sediminis]